MSQGGEAMRKGAGTAAGEGGKAEAPGDGAERATAGVELTGEAQAAWVARGTPVTDAHDQKKVLVMSANEIISV